MPSKSENQTATDDKVAERVSEARARLDRTREQLNTVREVMREAQSKRDSAINDAERVYGEEYSKGRDGQNAELRALDEAYGEIRSEVTGRWSNELSALSEARDAAIAAANSDFEDTQAAAKQTFGDDV